MKILSPLIKLSLLRYYWLPANGNYFLMACPQVILKKDQLGNCLPVRINGVYYIDSSFAANNFIEVQAEITYPGNYDITSDTVNGYFFHQSGKVERGTVTIRLMAKGKTCCSWQRLFYS